MRPASVCVESEGDGEGAVGVGVGDWAATRAPVIPTITAATVPIRASRNLIQPRPRVGSITAR